MATTTTENAAEAATGAGMPQLDFSTFPNQIFWLLVTLTVIYVVLSRVALPRIGSVLSTRMGTITNDLKAAEELKARAVEAEKAYGAALTKARADAAAIVAQAKAVIQADLAAAIATADAEIAVKAGQSEARIADIRAGAVDAVTEVARDTAAALVAALGGTADGVAIDTAVSARMKG